MSSSEVKIGELIYAFKYDTMMVGAVIKANEDKTYDVEWCSDEQENSVTTEKAGYVKAGIFSMKTYREAIGDTPQQDI